MRTKIKFRKLFGLWVGINVLWWIISINFNTYFGIDVNPFMNNEQEVIINLWIFMIGLMLLWVEYLYRKEEKMEDK